MYKKALLKAIFLTLGVFFLSNSDIQSQEFFSSAYELIYNIFSVSSDPNEGMTVFLSTLIPMGGTAESMGLAYTAVANNSSFLEINPSGSAILKNTEFSLFHNNWIADTRIEGIVFTQRFGSLGYAIGGKWLYIPFTERNDFGERAATGYYSEAIGIANIAYHFWPGYYFYGIAIGANFKIAYRSIPDYTDENGLLVKGSGLGQSAVAIMADVGLISKFNFLKPYSSRDKNFSIGLTVRNIGPPVLDEPLATVASLGIAYSFLRPLTLSMDIFQPINLLEFTRSEKFYGGIGASLQIADFWKMQAGFLLKSGNPRISLGATVTIESLIININYTLDLTTQITPLNRMSIEVKFNLGDNGRKAISDQVDKLYILGLEAYAAGDFELAKKYWEEALKLNPYFDPARESLAMVKAAIEVQKKVLEIQTLGE